VGLWISDQTFGLSGMTNWKHSISYTRKGEGGDELPAPVRSDRDFCDAGAGVRVNHVGRRCRDAEMFRRQMLAKAKQKQIAFAKVTQRRE